MKQFFDKFCKVLSCAGIAGLSLAAMSQAVVSSSAQSPVIAKVQAMQTASDKGSDKLKFVPGEIIIKLKDAAVQRNGAALSTSPAAQASYLSAAVPSFDQFSRRHGVKKIEKMLATAESGIMQQNAEDFLSRVARIKQKYPQRAKRAPANKPVPRLDGFYKVVLNNRTSNIDSACRELLQDASIESARPNYLYTTKYIPADPLYSQQWSHKVTSAESAWNIELGNSAVVVAVVDCGVDYVHEDLAANMVSGYDWVDIDTALYITSGYQTVRGEDYATVTDNDPMDFNGHGTHCAGIVAARAGNGKGVCGIAPGVKVMPVRAGFSIMTGMGEVGTLESDDIANAIRYAADNGADVISMSFGGGGVDQLQQDAIQYAASLGVVLVAAAGNDGSSSPSYPAAYDHVISVAATAQNDDKTYYSNYGTWVDVAAPGGDQNVDNQIWSTVPKTGGVLSDPSGYRAISGTSMATPYAAGVAALVLSRDPTRTADQVEQIMKQSIDVPMGIYYIGAGRLNAFKAVQRQPLNAQILVTAPTAGQLLTSQTVNITGTIEGTGAASYRVYYGSGFYPSTWTVISSGSTPVINGTLATWDVRTLASGSYSIRVVLYTGTDSLFQCVSIYLDQNIRAGWPKKVDVTVGLWGLTMSNTSTLADINNDGMDEIFVLSNAGIWGYRHDGSLLPGWPVVPQDLATSGISGESPSPAIGDIDNDGSLDVVAVLGCKVYALSMNGILKSGFPVTLGFGDPVLDANPFSCVQLADLDNNGKLEIIFKTFAASGSGQYNDHVEIFSSSGSRFMNWPYEFNSTYGGPDRSPVTREVIAADIDNDGKKEVITFATKTPAGTNAPTEAALFVWDYNGTLRTGYPIIIPNTYTNTSWNYPTTPIVADINNDGVLELGIVNHSMPYTQVVFIKFDGTIVPGWPSEVHMFQPCGTPTSGDVNHDGKLEIAYPANWGSEHAVVLFSNSGSLMPNWPKSVDGFISSQVIFADINNDSVPEIIATTMSGSIYAWTSAGSLVSGFPKLFVTPEGETAAMCSAAAIGDLDGNGKSELVATSRTGYIYVWNLPSNHVHTPLEWPMAFHDPQHSMLAKEPVYKPGVKILGSWVVGTTHTKEPGTNRALIVNVYGENPSVNVAVSSVTYGGQTMTKIVEKNQGTGTRTFAGAYILNESKIAAASSGAITVNWTTAPATGSSITSVFLSNVNQSSLTGATATGGVDAATAVVTSALATSSGDMVFLAAASANNGTYTMNNGFSRGGTEQAPAAPAWGDFTAGFKAATGASETPKVTSSLSQRQAIVGYVVKVAGTAPITYTITASAGTNGSISPSGTVTVTKGNSQTFTISPNSGYAVSSVTVDGVNQGAVSTYTFTNVTANHTIAASFAASTGGNVAILGSWLTGTTHTKEAGSNRALIVHVYGEHSAAMAVNSVTYGGQTMTKIVDKNQGTTTRTYVGAFILKESKIVAATNSSITVNWSATPSSGSSVYSVFVSNVNQTTLIGATGTGGSDTGVTVSTASLANSSGDMLLLAAASANNGTYTLNNGFIRGGTEQAPSWGDFTAGYRAGTGANKTPSVTSSRTHRQAIAGYVVKKAP